ncbi:hypothetical protein BH23VER1_BH23VER1_21070 [soil metagenome]
MLVRTKSGKIAVQLPHGGCVAIDIHAEHRAIFEIILHIIDAENTRPAIGSYQLPNVALPPFAGVAVPRAR